MLLCPLRNQSHATGHRLAASGREQVVSLGPGGGVTTVPSTRTVLPGARAWGLKSSRLKFKSLFCHLVVVFLDHTCSLSLNFFV